MNKCITLLLINIATCTIIFAQQGLVASGGDAGSTTGSLCYSFGQFACATDSNATGSVIEGIQQIVLSPNITPVTLLSFTAKLTDAQTRSVLLQWATAAEINSGHFAIERSAAATGNFETVHEVKAADNSSTRQDYYYTDYLPYTGNFFYRLKETDKDGKFTNSPIVEISLYSDKNISVAPNPAKDHFEIFTDNKNLTNGLQYALFDLSGRCIIQGRITENKTLVNISNLPRGIYVVQIIADNHAQQKFKIIRQ